MDLDEAIRTHLRWKITLRVLINGQEALDVAALGDASACELGRSLRREAETLDAYPAFRKLLHEHAVFHERAGEVARLVEAGRTEEASQLLAAEGEFMLASERTVAAILELKGQIEAASR